MAGIVCNYFLPARDKDLYILCISCISKECNIDDHCCDCHDWDDTKWQRMSDNHIKLAVQREKERKA